MGGPAVLFLRRIKDWQRWREGLDRRDTPDAPPGTAAATCTGTTPMTCLRVEEEGNLLPLHNPLLSLSLSLYSSHFLTNRGTALFCFQSTVSDTLQSLSLCCPVERAQGEEDAVQRQRHALRIQISKLYYTEKRGASGRIPGIIRRNNNTEKRIEFVWFRKHEWGERILPL